MPAEPPAPELRARRDAAVRRHVDAENAGDLDAMIASFHRPRYDVVPVGAVREGEDEVRALVGELLGAFADFRFETLRTHHAADAVILEARMRGRQRAPWAGIASLGRTMDLRLACVFDFDDDRLINETVYFDMATLHGQLTGA